MKSAAVAGAVAAISTVRAADTSSPVTKVLSLLSNLQTKIIKEGEEAQKEYDEYAEWCEDRAANVEFEIKTGKSNVAELSATIEEEKANADALNTKIEELASSIATDTADLKAATEVRTKEAADFATEEKELTEVISTLERATAILSREMAKGGAAMVQLQNAGNLAAALSAMVQREMVSSMDAQQLTAFVQSSQEASEDSDDVGAPAAAVYEGHSAGILDTLEGLSEKAQSQLADLRKKEDSALHNFNMLKQSLEDQVKFSNQDMSAAKKSLASSSEKKSVAEGDLSSTTADLNEDVKTLSGLHGDCMTRAQDFEAATKSRSSELDALAQAKKVIEEKTGGADSLSYSFLQLSSGADLANYEAVRVVRDLARKEKSAALAQLASQMNSAMRLGASGGDPFSKVKGLIEQMIEKLQSDASADASHKEYCDKELSESKEKEADQKAAITKLSTSIDQMTSRSAQLKEEVAELQKELAAAAKSQASWDKFRQEEKATFQKNKAEMEDGLEGIKMALKVLREYYAQADKAHGAAEGSASGIVGLLEVVESDFSKGLAEMTATEDSAESAYVAATKENELERTMKEKDVEYKTKESAELDKATAAATSDRAGEQAELDAVVEYLGKLEEMCVAKAEPYAEKKRRRDEEIAGLKEALSILEGEAVLLQKTSSKSLRGLVRAHRAVFAGLKNAF
eukprot:TRINITY_DN1889_c0_g2_i2.p1 TRINITY_DN1889_c0_g2~~TRINITY_DN1889_c0_g2_i2.p1  ORF type:complete len:712 (-),score=302.32 TRINITY_DN1889_c0_g2_i2:140-2203(-)